MLLQLDMLWLVDNTKWWIIYQPAAAIGGGGVRARERRKSEVYILPYFLPLWEVEHNAPYNRAFLTTESLPTEFVLSSRVCQGLGQAWLNLVMAIWF